MQNRLNEIRNEKNELKLSTILFLIIFLEIGEKFGLFLKLLESNFAYVIIIGDSTADSYLKQFLLNYFKVN